MELSPPHAIPAASNAVITPMLRTVLLCDIVESTALVERLGDMRAVALLQRHDHLLRQAMAVCNGLLIDKADGVLALFERPIQALDFALRYQRGLRELGQAEGLDLKARIGIHVGDVMTWANEPKDVLSGAKAFEVEGLAKPVAARLMNLALPGQILMSGMAQNLCQRAVGELGDAGARLRWLLHGRYSFKGVPAPMLVHEVGEPGLSPLRAPDSGAKAWRELPLWRRPPVMALEVVVVGLLALGLFWSTLRSTPAIAFAERDWVVVADLQNRTGETLFNDSLDTALRVGLEQSRHVNLVSELQIDRALERMQRQGQPIDRQLATELALREGAKAVILPTIAEVGGVVRVSLEVIDPNSGVTVYSDSADGQGVGDVLPALDTTIAQVRGQLGETMASIERASLPLEQVTTGNLEALRAYSLGIRARYDSRLPESRALMEEAIRRDPEFAMAHLNLAFLYYIEGDARRTRQYLDDAVANREHLTQREALFLDGAAATLDDPELAIEKFGLLASMYPDEFRAYYNYAYFAHNDLLRTEEGLAMLAPGLVPQNSRLGPLRYLSGAMRLALNQYAEAIHDFEQAESLGVRGTKREYIETFAAQRRFDLVAKAMQLQSATGSAAVDLNARLVEVSLPLDQGQFRKSVAAAEALAALAKSESLDPRVRDTHAGIVLLLRAYQPDVGFAKDLRAHAAVLVDSLQQADTLERRHRLMQVLVAAWTAAHGGEPALARSLLETVRGEALVEAYPANLAMQRATRAELALADGDAPAAIAVLAPAIERNQGLYLERAVLMRAYAANQDWTQAAALAEWLAANRGRAYGEANGEGLLQPANLIESGLALEALAVFSDRLGRKPQAAKARAAFKAAWPGEEGAKLAERWTAFR